MNKNNVLKIARTIYLQDIVSKSIFAALWNHNQKLPRSIGSLRAPQKLSSCFQAFIGSVQRTPTIQFIKKQGMQFTVYKIDLMTGTLTNQIYKTTSSLQELSWSLTILQSFISSDAGSASISNVLKSLLNSLTKSTDVIKKGINGRSKNQDQIELINNYINNISTQCKRLIGYLNTLNKYVSIKNFTNSIAKINTYLQSIKTDKQLNFENIIEKIKPLKDECDSINTLLVQGQDNNTFKSMSTNATRINVLNQVYQSLVDGLRYLDPNKAKTIQQQKMQDIKNQIQTKNTSRELSAKYRDINLQNLYNIIDRSYIDEATGEIDHKKQYQLQNGVRYSLSSLISFLKGETQTIKHEIFDKTMQRFYSTKNSDDPIFNDLFEKLQEIDELKEIIVKRQLQQKKKETPDKKYDDPDKLYENIETLKYDDFVKLNPQLMNETKEFIEGAF